MTSPEILPYWNRTYYVIVECEKGIFCKYGELSSFVVRGGDEIEAGQLIGYVGTVLNSDKIDETCPLYIRKLKPQSLSMLHFEIWKNKPITIHRNYLGGNWFSEVKIDLVLDRYVTGISWMYLWVHVAGIMIGIKRKIWIGSFRIQA
jgi:hypothetical protein